MKTLKQYTLELSHCKVYMTVITLAILSGYSVYFIFKPDVVSNLGYEDHFFEWATAICFLASSIIYLFIYTYSKNIFFLLLATALFIGFGEEISWGQRIFKFHTPPVIVNNNVQKETTFHNLELFNSTDLSGKKKTGIKRLLEINFLFKTGTIFLGIILPLCIFHFKTANKLSRKISLPIPPVSIGIFFGINWLIFRILHVYILKGGQSLNYYSAATEIYECLAAVIILILTIFFYVERKRIIPGNDIKQILFNQSSDDASGHISRSVERKKSTQRAQRTYIGVRREAKRTYIGVRREE